MKKIRKSTLISVVALVCAGISATVVFLLLYVTGYESVPRTANIITLEWVLSIYQLIVLSLIDSVYILSPGTYAEMDCNEIKNKVSCRKRSIRLSTHYLEPISDKTFSSTHEKGYCRMVTDCSAAWFVPTNLEISQILVTSTCEKEAIDRYQELMEHYKIFIKDIEVYYYNSDKYLEKALVHFGAEIASA